MNPLRVREKTTSTKRKEKSVWRSDGKRPGKRTSKRENRQGLRREEKGEDWL